MLKQDFNLHQSPCIMHTLEGNVKWQVIDLFTVFSTFVMDKLGKIR